jgi:hypothetical protein
MGDDDNSRSVKMDIRQACSLFHQFIKLVIHMQFCQFDKSTYAFAIDNNLRNRSCPPGCSGEFLQCRRALIYTHFLIGYMQSCEQVLCLFAKRAGSRAEDLYSGHYFSCLRSFL